MFGVFEFNPLYANTQYLYVLGVLLVCFVFVRTLVYSPFGQSLTGIRENMLRMHAVGSPVRWRLIVCYTISAALAGVAGALWAQTNAYVNLAALGLDRAATVLIVLILGGYGRLYGAFIGAVVYLALEHFLSQLYPTAWQLGLGLLLVLIALFARNGILGLGDSAVAALAPGREHAMTEPLLETRALSRNFGALARRARRRLPAWAGARHALIGPNGAGKTTFINLLTGVLPPTRRRGAVQAATSPPSCRPSASSSASRAPSRSTGCSAACRCWRMSAWRWPSASAPRPHVLSGRERARRHRRGDGAA